MSAGQLRERVAFESRGRVDDGYGNVESGEWVTEIGRIAARIEPRKGAESIQAARLAGRKPVLITVRVCDDTDRITTDWRARNLRTDELYNIRSKENPDEHRRYYTMEAESGVAF